MDDSRDASRTRGVDRREFLEATAALTLLALASARCGGGGGGGGAGPPPAVARPLCLYNGHLLTVDPVAALAPDTTADRHRLYVLDAILVDRRTGRVAAVHPPLGGPNGASPVESHPRLLLDEQPPPPGVLPEDLLAAWRSAGVPEDLLTNVDFVDLEGAVATPGLIDDHFHVTSWSKKLPSPGERFGFYADVSEPSFYLDPATAEERGPRAALTSIVAEANSYIAAQEREGIFLHGFIPTQVDEFPVDTQGEPIEDPRLLSHLYVPSGDGCGTAAYDPDYLLNGVGRGGALGDAAFEMLPAVLVHTSGQACWYNGRVLEIFNEFQASQLGTRFADVGIAGFVAPDEGAGETAWELQLSLESEDAARVLGLEVPFAVDVVALGSPDVYVAFEVSEVAAVTGTLRGAPMLPDQDARTPILEAAGLVLRAWYRAMPTCIPEAAWNEAIEATGRRVGSEGVAYGAWDPTRPHETNWYNGAERGLVQYVHDEAGGVWRPSGYAEHYVMRDLLSATVVGEPTVEEGMTIRRNLARWCHRHGITAVNDIMFYRRARNPEEFEALEGLSWDHDWNGGDGFRARTGVPAGVPTGQYRLRVGAYYYLENVSDVDEVLALADDPTLGSDVDRLRAPAGHPEFPGWVRWLGWKLQLDGGTGARTLFSNAPMSKATAEIPFATVDAAGRPITFRDHSFGLLTMTNLQEQVFGSRETALIYWLVRDSEGNAVASGGPYRRDWSFLRRGVLGWANEVVSPIDLHLDLLRLSVTRGIPLDDDARTVLVDKIGDLVAQVKDGYAATLQALVRIWYERTRSGGLGDALPHQVVCHCIGDGAVDLWVRMLRQLRDEVASLPANWGALPPHWRAVVPSSADMSRLRRTFEDERYRVEHLLNIAPGAILDIRNASYGLDAGTTPASRNVVFSTQPSLLVLDGQGIRNDGFPPDQELWEIPHEGLPDVWRGLPALPRSGHHMPCPVFADHDIPFTLNTDPPSVRDPRPALTILGAVARTPIAVDPGAWLDQDGAAERPYDYLVRFVFSPLGYVGATGENPMQLTVAEALAAMTFWAAYVSGQEKELGALAAAPPAPGEAGYYADLVVWSANPLALRGPDGSTLGSLGRSVPGPLDARRVDTANAWIRGFRPAWTMVGGEVVYRRDG